MTGSAAVVIIAANTAAINNAALANNMHSIGDGQVVIFGIILVLTISALIMQYVFWMMMLAGNDFYSKETALISLIPFGWTYFLYKKFKNLR